MSLHLTLVLFVIFASIAAFSAWRGAQPPNLIKGPRMVPYRLVMLISAAVTVAMLVHLVNLAGFQTGRS